jgi:branched-chain amino acid transport system substrate-binding protein
MSVISLRVGATLSQTGTYALQGQQALQGLRLWLEDTNEQGGLFVAELRRGVPLQLITYDDRSRRPEVERLIEQLINHDRVDLLIGPYSSGLTRAAAGMAEWHQKVLWNHGGSSDTIMQQGFHWLVNLPTPASRYFAGLFTCLAGFLSNEDRVAIVQRRRGAFAAEVAMGAKQQAESGGLAVLSAFFYPETPGQFLTLARDLAAAKPAMIVGVGRYEDDVALVRALAQMRLRVKALAVVAAPLQAFWEDLQGLAEGCIGPSQWEPGRDVTPDVSPTSTAFVERFRRRYGQTPDYPAAQAYAAGLVMQRGIALAGTCANVDLRKATRTLVCQTFYGGFQLDSVSGAQVGHETVLIQWQHGMKRIIHPVAVAQAAPLMPQSLA